jgi:hypothetical protein
LASIRSRLITIVTKWSMVLMVRTIATVINQYLQPQSYHRATSGHAKSETTATSETSERLTVEALGFSRAAVY